MDILTDRVPSPIGDILVYSDDECLRALDFEDYEGRSEKLLRRDCPDVRFRRTRDPAGITTALCAYLDGELDAIDALPCRGDGTPFQQRVWRTLREIPAGRTWSYGELARRIGKPSASRAVGLANGRNPIAIVVPCHRVIGADGSLTGYGGGLARKQWLLRHEGALLL